MHGPEGGGAVAAGDEGDGGADSGLDEHDAPVIPLLGGDDGDARRAATEEMEVAASSIACEGSEDTRPEWSERR